MTRITAKRASLILATTEETRKRLKQLGANRVQLLSEAGLPRNEVQKTTPAADVNRPPFRILSVGRLLHLKGFHLALLALERFRKQVNDIEYWCIGDGPEKKRLERLTEKLKLTDIVTFLGHLPREEVLRSMHESHVLLHPSLHDSGGWVCLEAMSCFKPVICLDNGGPAVQVTRETGFKIRTISPDQVVEDLADSMVQLFKDRDLYRRMGFAARERVEQHFRWDSKGLTMNAMYLAVSQGEPE